MKKAMALVLLALALPRPALAEGDACANASEEGQRARREGDLRNARERFASCSADPCKSPLRDDCAKWAGELDAQLATPARGHTVWPWIVVAAGAASIVTGVLLSTAAAKVPANCDTSSGECFRLQGESEAQLQQDKSATSDHVSTARLGLVFGISGLVLVVGGLVWHFVEPTGPATARLETPLAFAF